MERMERLEKQIQFIVEIDKAKTIFRQTYLSDGKRRENDSEHSWHLAVMAFLLSEYFEDVDVQKVVKMVLIHDLIEIYAGDTYCYDEKANEDKEERERKAADMLYHILPSDQEEEYKKLWMEFEYGQSKEAVFASILDRLQPILLNYASGGKAWMEHGVHKSQVVARNQRTMEGPKEIAALFTSLIDKAVEKGYLKDDEGK